MSVLHARVWAVLTGVNKSPSMFCYKACVLALSMLTLNNLKSFLMVFVLFLAMDAIGGQQGGDSDWESTPVRTQCI